MRSQRRRAVSAAARPGYHGVQKQGPPAVHRGAAAGGLSPEGSAMLKAFVDNLITPLIAAIFGKPDFSGLAFTINGSIFRYGLFINALITFVLLAAAVYFVVVAPMDKLAERRARGADRETKQCPECLSEISHGARKCAFCGSPQNDVTPA